MVAGGPSADSGRLDYLVQLGRGDRALDHRAVSDAIAASPQTPGARLSNAALGRDPRRAARTGRRDPDAYRRLVEEALDYRIDVLERAIAVLDRREDSVLRDVHRALEADAQAVWGRRLALQASDLVRFSRTYRYWRNAQVEMLDADGGCRDAARARSPTSRSPTISRSDAGMREVALATVTSTAPAAARDRLAPVRRRHDASSRCTSTSEALAEHPLTTLKIQKTSFKFGQMPLGQIHDRPRTAPLSWEPAGQPAADGRRSPDRRGRRRGSAACSRPATRSPSAGPSLDNQAAPKPTCTPTSYDADPGRAPVVLPPARGRSRPSGRTSSPSGAPAGSSTRRCGRRWSTRTASTCSPTTPPNPRRTTPRPFPPN